MNSGQDTKGCSPHHTLELVPKLLHCRMCKESLSCDAEDLRAFRPNVAPIPVI